jgi:membrane dipeptidase
VKRIVIGVLAVLAVAAAIFFFAAAPVVGARMNRVERPAHSPAVTAATEKFIEEQGLVDLHADSLLWGRDLLERSKSGHVDLPRLEEGHYRLQIFDAVTKTPRNLNIERNDDSTDNIALLALAQRWPLQTQASLLARAVWQGGRLHGLVAHSNGRMHFVAWREDLANRGGVGALLGLEGAQALEDRVDNVELLFNLGFRVIGLAHFFDNHFAGSAHGVEKGGLSKDGLALLERLEKKQMIVDLAHASPQTVNDVLDHATRPVLVSHTGVRGTCDNSRNLSDDQLRRIAKNGGLVGIGFWPQAVCGNDAAAVARAVKYAVSVAGAAHVALGSDFDGAVTVPFDASQTGELIQSLFDAGLDRETLKAVMSGNAVRFLAEALPPKP